MKLPLTLIALAATITASAAAPRGPATRPSTQPVGNPGESGVDVAIKSAKIDFLLLKKPQPGGGFEDLSSDTRLLVITLAIANKGQKEINYVSFSGTDPKSPHASLIDSNGKFPALINFGDLEPADLTRKATLKPGDAITDVVVFQVPAANARPNILVLPAANHGDKGQWRLQVKLDEEAK